MWPPDDVEAFWSWSCERYARPGVAEACLSLQDRHGVQVNLLLLGCWLGERGRAVTAEQAERISDAAASWEATVVRPLRETRRRLKSWETEVIGAGRPAVATLRRAVAASRSPARRRSSGNAAATSPGDSPQSPISRSPGVSTT